METANCTSGVSPTHRPTASSLSLIPIPFGLPSFSSIITAPIQIPFKIASTVASAAISTGSAVLSTFNPIQIWSDRHTAIEEIRKRLANSKTYDEWKSVAGELDSYASFYSLFHGPSKIAFHILDSNHPTQIFLILSASFIFRKLSNDAWRANPASSDYDYKLILFRLTKLRNTRESGDVLSLIYMLRSGLLRNLGGLNDPRLFSVSYAGTKNLIESYHTEVVTILDHILNTNFPQLTPQMKLDFFHETYKSFGCSALVLQGGATFGLYHLGVVKALFEQGLLPRIISGSAVGALIAALVCIHSDTELKEIFETGGINLQAFVKVGKKGNFRRKITRLLKYGYLLDVKVLEDCVRSNVGDITFEEAFQKTRRILNITVSSSRTNEVPRLLNYLTAPNVLIWSAACASTTATYPLYSKVDLLAKDTNGVVKKWHPNGSDIKWGDPSISEGESPHTRLAELFNVNHFIVSQAGATAAPFVVKGFRDEKNIFWNKLLSVVMMEVRVRACQAASLGIIPSFLAKWAVQDKLTGDVTIVPDLDWEDYKNAFNNPTPSDIDYWLLKGERSTWPMISIIKNRCMIELALDKNYLKQKSRLTEKSRSKKSRKRLPHARAIASSAANPSSTHHSSSVHPTSISYPNSPYPSYANSGTSTPGVSPSKGNTRGRNEMGDGEMIEIQSDVDGDAVFGIDLRTEKRTKSIH
ncbi:acyl transferase/acyl hydrolase/lysophospholipase [Paraphysoderma sedebokerense]|nr:acyl transferase/acyl hydrolase/lysophospholipase [Paraphysoderma sedebokerense]